jgi:hypothetical protein
MLDNSGIGTIKRRNVIRILRQRQQNRAGYPSSLLVAFASAHVLLSQLFCSIITAIQKRSRVYEEMSAMCVSRTTVLVLALSAASLCVSRQLSADIVNYNVTGELSGGGIISGTLTFNSITQTITNYGIGVTGDTLLIAGCGSLVGTPECVNGEANDYLPGGSFSSFFSCGYSGPTTLYACSSPNIYPDINFTFSSPLGSSQDAVDFSVYYFQQGTVASANADGGTGYVAPMSQLPEPRLTFLIVVILAGILAAKLRTRVRTTRPPGV